MQMPDAKRFDYKAIINRVGLPTIIIAAFWLVTLVLGTGVGLPLNTLLSDTIKRFGMNGILVLAMVPSIQSGSGPNFALPVGISCGLLAMVISIELGLFGATWLVVSCVLAIAIGIVVGYFYGRLMNAVKGSEMTIATYTGFSITAFMCLIWLAVPFTNENMRWFIGAGLRDTIQLDAIGGAQILNNWGAFTIGGITIPTGLLLMFFAFCFLMWLFFRSKSGTAISAAGDNPMFAKAAGINSNHTRVLANIISTVLGAIGIIVYAQSYGYAQIYSAPMMMAFPAVASVLIGGASTQRARVFHVIVGALLFQGLMATAMPVANQIFAGSDLSETIRMVLQNGIILYALMQAKGGKQ